MATCPKCGAEVDKDDQFCGSCGAPLTTKTEESPVKEHYAREEDVCFEARRHADYTGLVSFGSFLLIVGIIFVANPNIISNFHTWGQAMSNTNAFAKPPLGLINSAALFFGLIGVSDFLVASLRFVAQKRRRRVLRGALNGVGLLVLSYLLYLYGKGTLRGVAVLALEVVVIGLLVIVYAVARYLIMK